MEFQRALFPLAPGGPFALSSPFPTAQPNHPPNQKKRAEQRKTAHRNSTPRRICPTLSTTTSTPPDWRGEQASKPPAPPVQRRLSKSSSNRPCCWLSVPIAAKAPLQRPAVPLENPAATWLKLPQDSIRPGEQPSKRSGSSKSTRKACKSKRQGG